MRAEGGAALAAVGHQIDGHEGHHQRESERIDGAGGRQDPDVPVESAVAERRRRRLHGLRGKVSRRRGGLGGQPRHRVACRSSARTEGREPARAARAAAARPPAPRRLSPSGSELSGRGAAAARCFRSPARHWRPAKAPGREPAPRRLSPSGSELSGRGAAAARCFRSPARHWRPAKAPGREPAPRRLSPSGSELSGRGAAAARCFRSPARHRRPAKGTGMRPPSARERGPLRGIGTRGVAYRLLERLPLALSRTAAP